MMVFCIRQVSGSHRSDDRCGGSAGLEYSHRTSLLTYPDRQIGRHLICGTIRLSILRVKCRPVVRYSDGRITDITNTH